MKNEPVALWNPYSGQQIFTNPEKYCANIVVLGLSAKVGSIPEQKHNQLATQKIWVRITGWILQLVLLALAAAVLWRHLNPIVSKVKSNQIIFNDTLAEL